LSVQSVNHPRRTRAQDIRAAAQAGSDAGVTGEPTGASSDPAAAERIESRAFDGLEWKFRAAFGRVLEALPAAAWADPGERGWQRVKHNATRAVWRARIDEAVYYLKYYARPRWMGVFKRAWRGPTCETEWQGGLYALRAGIPAVRPVACTNRVSHAGRVCSLLVTEAVEPAYPLSRYWEMLKADDDAARRRRDTTYLIDLLAEMIARAHQSGFEHRDMHAANILVHPLAPGRYETVFVDLQSARRGTPLEDRAVVRNLAQLNQWFRRHSSIGDRLRFLRRYLRWRNEYEQAFEHARPLDLSFERLVAALTDAAERHAERLWAKRDRRARRSNRYFSRIRVAGGWRGMVFLRCKRPVEESRASAMALNCDWWREQLANPLRWFDPDGGHAYKQSHSALVTRAVLPTETEKLPVIIKRPLARNWRRQLRQFLAPSRSVRGWRIGHALLNRDIPAARPLAALERCLGPVVLDSLLLTEALPAALDLDAYLRREFAARPPADWWWHKQELSGLLVRHVRQLADRGFIHRDCKAQNVLVVAGPRLKLLWIDMDGLKRTRRPPAAPQLQALLRLHVSLLDVPGLTRADRVRFLKAYLARFGSDPRAWRSAWHELARAAEEKIRAKGVRRAWKLKHYGRA
jgi:hypothetical protein